VVAQRGVEAADPHRCLRLVRDLAGEQAEEWREGTVYLNMPPFKQERRKRLRQEVA
jgi:hypothetical protein